MNTSLNSIFSIGAEGIFYVLLFVFTLHATFLGYHWLSYGEKRSVALTALATYLLGGAVLFITLAITLGKI